VKRLVSALVLVLTACAGAQDHRLIVAAGTTLVDSGILEDVVEAFEAEHPNVELSVVGESTSQVLQLGRLGGADVMITHGPELEAQFVEDGLAARYELVFVSSFVVVGPPDGLAGGPVVDALTAIAGNAYPFVSRADGSGTHEAEQALWAAAAIDPVGQPWYLETGQGMGLTLQVADQRNAYTLAELGSYLTAAATLSLRPLAVPDLPPNPYHLIVVASSPELATAETFLDWLTGPAGRAAIEQANLNQFGRVVYAATG
jgi:tungstate transport system substrate-binding protein